MTCRIACQRQSEPPRHLPTWLPADLPDGFAECLLCGDWITAVDLFEGVCSGAPATHPDQLHALPSGDEARDVERERVLAMVTRCAEHQR